MRKARKQNGSLYLDVNGSKVPVWMFSWFHIMPTGRRVRRKRQVGTLDQYKTEAAAERAVRSWRLAINSNEANAFSGITMQDLIAAETPFPETSTSVTHTQSSNTRAS